MSSRIVLNIDDAKRHQRHLLSKRWINVHIIIFFSNNSRFSKHLLKDNLFKILFEKEYILWTESWESWFVFSGSSSSIGGLVALCLRICCLNSSLELLDTDTELQKIKNPIKSDEWSRNSVKVSRFWNGASLKHSSNCAKIKKYSRNKYVSNFFDVWC